MARPGEGSRRRERTMWAIGGCGALVCDTRGSVGSGHVVENWFATMAERVREAWAGGSRSDEPLIVRRPAEPRPHPLVGEAPCAGASGAGAGSCSWSALRFALADMGAQIGRCVYRLVSHVDK
jgi:hypothetical protein